MLPMVQRSADAELGTSRSMFLSILLHGLLIVGLFAFDGLTSMPWRQLGAERSAPQFLEVEMLSSQQDSQKSVQMKPPEAVSVPNPDVQKQPDVISSEQAVTEQSNPAGSATANTNSGGANSDGASVTTASAVKLADAEMVYLNDLRQLLESKKEYPIAARRMGHRGRVVVRFVLERDGRVRKAEIVQGSQSEILNRAARGLIGRLHDVKPFPKEVALTEWAVVVPIEYQM
ncbi:MAG: energy transducer TonB [Deltaproteobacteria bacterium]|nr:energy transducer TonB [Deltaproteobacteria bacterium]